MWVNEREFGSVSEKARRWTEETAGSLKISPLIWTFYTLGHVQPRFGRIPGANCH